MLRQAYAKLQCLDGEDHYVTELPYIIGSAPTSHNIFRCRHMCVLVRLGEHCTLTFRENCFELIAKGSVWVVNSGQYADGDPPVVVSDLSCVSIPCVAHQQHVFHLILPFFAIPSLKVPGTAAIPDTEEIMDSCASKQLESTAMKTWGMNEKESLKKWLLIYGYGRWSKLQDAMSEGGSFQKKAMNEIRSFASGFVRTLAESLPMEKQEMKSYLLGIIEEKPDDFFVPPKLKEWGMMMRQRSIAWAKRIQLLYSVRRLIKKFKECSKDGHLKLTNLLNFLPSGAFYGQRPSAWWTRRHDIDLIRGTYQYGYANYFAMRNDKQLSFSQIESDTTFKDFPNADTITRRLKKLMQSVNKFKEFDFDKEQQYFEVTGWSVEDKQALLDLVSDYGVPLNAEGKNDWSQLKEKFDAVRPGAEKNVNNIERMVQHLRMLAQHILHPEDGQAPDMKDADGFSMSSDKAEQLQESMNTIQFIRKHVLKGGSEFFNNELPALEKSTQKEREENPTSELPWHSLLWKCAEHDRGLLNAVADNGLRFLSRISNSEIYSFSQLRITEDMAKTRIRALCEFFRNIKQSKSCKFHLVKKKRYGDELAFEDKGVSKPVAALKKAKPSRFIAQRDDAGGLIYPIVISSSLSILNLGEIDVERPAYHTERNIFPIGFKSIREHISMFSPPDRMQYLCEILDGGSKPLFRVTPLRDGSQMEDQCIERDSCTGCWIVICMKINELQKSRRSKVTVSGTERFGLWDANVVRLIHELPGASLLVRPEGLEP